MAALDADMVQWWTNDQTFFNEVVHAAPTMHEPTRALKLSRTAKERQLAISHLEAMISESGRSHLARVSSLLDRLGHQARSPLPRPLCPPFILR